MKNYPAKINIKDINRIDDLLKDKCQQLSKYVKENCLHSNSKVASIGYDKVHISRAFVAVSGNPKEVNYEFEMQIAIEMIGKIGEQHPEKTGTYLGACAEQRAANEVVKDGQKDIDKIGFSTAIRPRTKLPVKPCVNCKKLFKI